MLDLKAMNCWKKLTMYFLIIKRMKNPKFMEMALRMDYERKKAREKFLADFFYLSYVLCSNITFVPNISISFAPVYNSSYVPFWLSSVS